MKQYVIGLDIGTSSVKGVLLAADGSGEQIADRRSFRYTTRSDRSMEITADRYLGAVCTLLRSLASSVPKDGKLAAVSMASASGNTVLLDQSSMPLTPIFNWQDRRATDEPGRILGVDFDPEAYYISTGWGFDGQTFPLAHLAWLACHEPEKLASAAYVGMSTEYLCRVLTDTWGISTSAGTPFYLIDQMTGAYRLDILDRYDIPESKLPPVVPVGSEIGRVTRRGAARSGLPAGTPVIAGTFDHPSAARGVGVLNEGQMLLSCGTSWVGFYPIGDRKKLERHHLLIDPFLSASGGPWAGMTSLASVVTKIGGAVNTYLDNTATCFRTLEKEARKSEPGAGGLVITLTDADDPEQIAASPRPHIARAIMECVARMLKADTDRLSSAGIRADSAVMVGGPSANPFWTTVIEEITGIRTEIRHGAFAGARGAAIVAGIGAGIWKDEAEALSVLG